jgi:rRNA biogenesis protein RRP5
MRHIALIIQYDGIFNPRKILERAFKTIGYRDESFKLDIWITLLHMDSLQGKLGSHEIFQRIFQRARIQNNKKQIYQTAIGICERNGLSDICKYLMETSCKMFPHSAKVWLYHIKYYQKRNEQDSLLKVVKQSLHNLPPEKQIKIFTKISLDEYNSGNLVRSRNMLIEIINSFPNRLDLWFKLIEQEIQHGNKGNVRNIFDRITAMKLTPAKMKTIYKRYLEYEYKYGTHHSIALVRKKTRDFVLKYIPHKTEKYLLT